MRLGHVVEGEDAEAEAEEEECAEGDEGPEGQLSRGVSFLKLRSRYGEVAG